MVLTDPGPRKPAEKLLIKSVIPDKRAFGRVRSGIQNRFYAKPGKSLAHERVARLPHYHDLIVNCRKLGHENPYPVSELHVTFSQPKPKLPHLAPCANAHGKWHNPTNYRACRPLT